MACAMQNQALDALSRQSSLKKNISQSQQKARGSIPTVTPPPEELQWPPPVPVSMHTSQLRLKMMNEDPKDLHTARLIIGELRTKIRCQSEHIMKWRKAYALQVQQHFRYQKEKSEQMNALTSQLLLLEARMKRKQKQIAGLLTHRELAIQRQQKVIDTLNNRLTEHGIETNDACYSVDTLDSLNDSDSAVVLEDIDSDTNMPMSVRRRSSGSGGVGCSSAGSGSGIGGFDGVTVARSISDAIETSLNKYSSGRRNNCFLRRPEILETVYSVEEDPEPTTDVAEKRDKFKNRSGKIQSSSSTEGNIDEQQQTAKSDMMKTDHALTLPRQPLSPIPDGHTACSMIVPQIVCTSSTSSQKQTNAAENNAKSQVNRYNRVMSNHRSVTKPKDVKYKRINKAKSKSLEELRGRLKEFVERNDSNTGGSCGGGYKPGLVAQTAQSFA